MVDPITYFWLLLKASLFSSGGTGNLPSLYSDLLARGWASDRQFAQALAIGQISPGPSGLWVIALGYLTDGVRGSLLATLAISLPPLTVLLLARLHRRFGDHPATKGFVRGLGLAVVANVVIVMITLLLADVDLRSLLIFLASIAIGATRRVPVIVHLALAGLVGVLLY